MASTAVRPEAETRLCGTDCATCRRLREAAARLAVEHGIANVTVEDLADAVGMQPVQLALHRDGGPHTSIGHAYLETSAALHAVWAANFAAHGTWAGGLRGAMDGLLQELVEDDVAARLCFVEVPRGDRELLALREGVRRRNVEILCEQYVRHHAGDSVPEIHIELVCGMILHAIAEGVANDRTDALGERVDEILAVAGA